MHDLGKEPPPYSAVGDYPKAPYPTGGAPYPTGGAPYPTGGAPYPTGDAPYPMGGAPYASAGAPYPMGGAPYASAGAPYASGGAPYNSGQAPYASAGAPYNSGAGDTPAGEFAFSGHSFSEKHIRHAFIRKVYLILTTQLLFTSAIVAVFISSESIKEWVQRNQWFYWISYVVFFVTYLTLACCSGVRRRSPGNYIALAVFTLAFSYMTATIASFYSIPSVLIALAITALLCLSISLFAIQTRIDFTMCTSLLFVLTIVLFFTGIACMIVGVQYGAGKVLYAVYGGLAALVFGLYLVYDTQTIMGGRKHELSPEDYIVGALQLYVDVVNLFLIILSLFGKRE